MKKIVLVEDGQQRHGAAGGLVYSLSSMVTNWQHDQCLPASGALPGGRPPPACRRSPWRRGAAPGEMLLKT